MEPMEKTRVAKIVPTLHEPTNESSDGAPSKVFCEPDSKCDSIVVEAKKIRAARRRPLLVLSTHFIDDGTVKDIYSMKKDVLTIVSDHKEPDAPVLDVLIHSPGGELSSCFKIARLLAQWINCWEALWPAPRFPANHK